MAAIISSEQMTHLSNSEYLILKRSSSFHGYSYRSVFLQEDRPQAAMKITDIQGFFFHFVVHPCL